MIVEHPLPPAILITWSRARGDWVATAVIDQTGEPIILEGPSSGLGPNPSAALQELLAKRFVIAQDEECPATLVSISMVEEPT